MSRFSGPQHKGAQREFLHHRRIEISEREIQYREEDAVYERRITELDKYLQKHPLSPTERILWAIFGRDENYMGTGDPSPC